MKIKWIFWSWVLWLSFGIGIQPSSIPSISSAQSSPQSINSELTLRDASGYEGKGLYLGNGFILTSWQMVSGERFLWAVDSQIAPPLRYQLPEYNDDGIDQPWEAALQYWLCPNKRGYEIQETALQPSCFPYNLTFGMSVIGGSRAIPIQKLVYANREYDLAIVMANADELAAIPPAQLNSFALSSHQPLFSVDKHSIGIILEGNPIKLTNPWHGDFETSAQQILANRATAPNMASFILSQPYYNQRGEVVGLGWASQGDMVFINPTAVWYNLLWQVQHELHLDGLLPLLKATTTPVAVSGAPSMGDTFSPELGNSGYDVLHYDLDLTMIPKDRFVGGSATLTIRATLHHLYRFSLDLRQMAVEKVNINGYPTEFLQTDRKLWITLPTPQAFGTVFEVQITYQGTARRFSTPYSRFFTVGLEYSSQPLSMAFINQPDGADTWFPCNNHPVDRATYDFHITVPDGNIAVANGQPFGVTPGSEFNTYHWRMAYPMVTGLTMVSVGDYVMFAEWTTDNILLRHYVYRDTQDQAAALFSGTPLALHYLQRFFGNYPYPSYGHVVTPLEGGALETQMMTAMPIDTTLATSEEQLFDLIVHELAHQWYGNTVSLKSWEDIWLNEGMATYAEWLALEERYGIERPLNIRKQRERVLLYSPRETPLAFPNQDEMFSIESYDKGAWIFHMLRQRIGDETFFELIRLWVEWYAERPVTTDDFFQLAESISGQDLTQFRRQWLESPDMPRYILYWTTDEDGLQILACNQGPTAYRLNLPLQVINDKSQSIFLSFSIDLTNDTAYLPLEVAPQYIVPDPTQQVLGSFIAEYTEQTPSCLLKMR